MNKKIANKLNKIVTDLSKVKTASPTDITNSYTQTLLVTPDSALPDQELVKEIMVNAVNWFDDDLTNVMDVLILDEDEDDPLGSALGEVEGYGTVEEYDMVVTFSVSFVHKGTHKV